MWPVTKVVKYKSLRDQLCYGSAPCGEGKVGLGFRNTFLAAGTDQQCNRLAEMKMELLFLQLLMDELDKHLSEII